MKNGAIFIVLALLAIVPVTLSFLGDEKDPEPAASTVGESEVEVEADEPAPAAVTGKSASGKPAAQTRPAKKARVVVPVFPGYENARYQQYDALIARLVADFNAHRDSWAGGTKGQGAAIAEITAAQVKAHMIQETGGGDVRSRAAWAKDPLQVNVPGDWNPYKKYLGLREPRKRNEGTLEKNLRAGIMLLARKGFGVSGQPAGNKPTGTFDGWTTSLKRYNGRSDKAADGRPYRESYAERILDRATHPKKHVPIAIQTR